MRCDTCNVVMLRCVYEGQGKRQEEEMKKTKGRREMKLEKDRATTSTLGVFAPASYSPGKKRAATKSKYGYKRRNTSFSKTRKSYKWLQSKIYAYFIYLQNFQSYELVNDPRSLPSLSNEHLSNRHGSRAYTYSEELSSPQGPTGSICTRYLKVVLI